MRIANEFNAIEEDIIKASNETTRISWLDDIPGVIKFGRLKTVDYYDLWQNGHWIIGTGVQISQYNKDTIRIFLVERGGVCIRYFAYTGLWSYHHKSCVGEILESVSDDKKIQLIDVIEKLLNEFTPPP